ncbi:AIPR family protein [Yersinia enterocolitica]|uniref:AIPR family protein n=1 Tax=Yersinia enterocolitica TaxID=630 RepID=UPI001C61078E|nr:AIPR family protein [Yersinia enterocolitica]MBW5853080.1 AIPR family protein [Yersinia enterocolitica]
MAFVNDLKVEDNNIAAAATANVTAQRLGSTLRERYEAHIHKRECVPSQQDYNVKMASRALAAFTMYHLGSVDDITAGNCVCDSSNDGGIDGICINHSEKLVVVVQSKFNQSGSGTWTKDDFLSFKDACEKLQKEQFHLFDEVLKNRQSDIKIALNSLDYKFIFAMTHTGKRGAADLILFDMQQWQKELNEAAFTDNKKPKEEWDFQVHLVSAEDLINWIHSGSRGAIDLEQVELLNYGQIDKPHQAFYGVVSGDQIMDWWKGYGQRLFTKNIRNILGSTDVNDEIRKTALNDPEMFWFYNNGITLLVDEVEQSRRNVSTGPERGTFTFKDVSVINGAQTVSSIGSLSTIPPEKLSKVKVLARFIKVNDDENNKVSNLITRANNLQNRVLGRDFASQQPDQHRLSHELILEGYQYQLLRTDENPTQKNPKVIDLDEALNALACLTKIDSVVAQLKSNRGRFFENFEGSLYKSVFNPKVPGIKLINAVLHFRIIEEIITTELDNVDRSVNSRRYLILTHANRYFCSVVLNMVPKLNVVTTLLQPDRNLISSNLLNLIADVELYMAKNHPSAYPARFFSNANKIKELYENI